jgi:K+-sensing histidine kinase KdpD
MVIMEILTEPNVLVCVTDQPTSERLIRVGASIAQDNNIALNVVCVLPKGFVSENTSAILQNLYDTANTLGAEMFFYFNSEPALTIAVHAKKKGTVHIVSGKPGANSNMFIETIKGLLPQLPISIVDSDNRIFTIPAVSTANQPIV